MTESKNTPTPTDLFAHLKKPNDEAKALMSTLVAVYEEATPQDRALAAEIVACAKIGQKDAEVKTLTPGAAAILFFDHNKQNREWTTSTSADYCAQIVANEWEFIGDGICLNPEGAVNNGQHRLAGIAAAGKPVQIVIVYGVDKKAIIAMDKPKPRDAAQFLSIGNQVEEPKSKQMLVKTAFGVLKRIAKGDAAMEYTILAGVRGARKIEHVIVQHDALLNRALEIGAGSVHGRAKPTIKEAHAGALAFVFLLKAWPEERIIENLQHLQSGQDKEGGASPLFVAADQLQKLLAKREKGTVSQHLAMLIKAFVLHEQGVKAVRSNELTSAMKPNADVDPAFPGAWSKAAE